MTETFLPLYQITYAFGDDDINEDCVAGDEATQTRAAELKRLGIRYITVEVLEDEEGNSLE